jgi:adenosylcobinamide-GDP ribazoletransferase
MEATAVPETRRSYILAPVVALEFLTLLRLRRPALVSPAVLGASQAFFPLVGLLLGGIAAAAAFGLGEAGLGAGVRGWLLAALMLVLTGGLHADGLADSADGLFAGATPARRLEVMRDPAIGAFGAAALIVVIGTKAAAMAELAGSAGYEALVLAPCLARWACVASIAAFPYARPEGLGSAFHGSSLPWAAPFAGLSCLAAAVAGLGPEGGAAWLIAAGAGLVLGAFVASRLVGLTGDSYGAVIEVSEAALLVLAVGWY